MTTTRDNDLIDARLAVQGQLLRQLEAEIGRLERALHRQGQELQLAQEVAARVVQEMMGRREEGRVYARN
jgi:hypothetical protein